MKLPHRRLEIGLIQRQTDLRRRWERNANSNWLWTSTATDLPAYSEVIKNIIRDQVVLDVGSGNGAIWTYLKPAALRALYLVEALPDLHSASRERWAARSNHRVYTFNGTVAQCATKLPEPPTVALFRNVWEFLDFRDLQYTLFSLPPSIETVVVTSYAELPTLESSYVVRQALPEISPIRRIALLGKPYYASLSHTHVWLQNAVVQNTQVLRNFQSWRHQFAASVFTEPCPDCGKNSPDFVSHAMNIEVACSCGYGFRIEDEKTLSALNHGKGDWSTKIRECWNKAVRLLYTQAD